MSGARTRAGWTLGASVALLAITAAGCSKDSSEPESKRACAVVQADELSKMADAEVELQEAEKGSPICRFTSKDGAVEIQFEVSGPVEEGTPQLLLPNAKEVADVGDEAWIATQGTRLGTAMVARKGGSMLTIDLGATKLTGKERAALATEIATAGVEKLPKMDVKPAGGERGDDACKRYTTDDVAVLLGGVPIVTPSTPAGSCQLEVALENLTVRIGILKESGATKADLDAIVSAVETETPAKVGDNAAYWLDSLAGPEAGGQLYVLSDGRLIQVAVVGDGFLPTEGQALATEIAKIANA